MHLKVTFNYYLIHWYISLINFVPARSNELNNYSKYYKVVTKFLTRIILSEDCRFGKSDRPLKRQNPTSFAQKGVGFFFYQRVVVMTKI
jgi:hypothetical protein